jgi:hypothetical protein
MKTLIRILFLCFVFCFFGTAFCFGQQAPGIEWQNTIGGSGIDLLTAIQQTNDGGYMLGGCSFSGISGDKNDTSRGYVDYWMVKIDSIGNVEWQHTIGGNNYDYLTCIKQTKDEGYILGGSSNSDMSGNKTENNYGDYDFWIVKTDSLGNIQWQNTIGGSLSDDLTSLQLTEDGGYILGGWSESSMSGNKTENNCDTTSWPFTPTKEFWIIKIDSVGNIQWQNTIGGKRNELLIELKQTNDKGYILGGRSQSNISCDKMENNLGALNTWDYWIVKIDSSGNIQWQNTIGGNADDMLTSILLCNDEGYILGGFSESNISGDKTENSIGGSMDYWVVKTDSMGTIQWQNTIGGNNLDELRSINHTNDGGYILGGSSFSNISGDKSQNSIGNGDNWLVRIDALGNIKWDKTVGGNDEDATYSLQQTMDRGYIIASSSKSNMSGDKTENSNGDWDYWIVKLYADTTTGISNLQVTNYDLKVFPNPAKDEITIAGYALQNNQPAVLKIYDVMGNEVYHSSVTTLNIKLKTLNFSPGVYFVQLQTGAKVSRVKFVKQ